MKNIKKVSLIVLSVALLGLGWFLEVYYYQFRFSGDGVDSVVSILIGIGLTLLLTSLFINVNIGKIIVIIPLVVFSIFCTTSGQNYSYNIQSKSNSIENASEENNRDRFDYYTEKIQQLNIELQHENSLLPDNIKDRTYLNKNGVQPLLDNIKSIKADIKEYEVLRDGFSVNLNSSNNINVSSKSAYEMLAEDLGLTSPTPLKLISQAILSLFIALMAPTGVRILSTIFKPVHSKAKKQPEPVKITTEEDIVKKYADSRFRGEEKPSTLKGRGETTKETGLSHDKFNKISKRAISLNLITVNGNMTIANVTRSQFIVMMINKQKFISNNLKAVHS